MDYSAYLRFVLAFALVMGLIVLCAYLARRLGFGGKIGSLRNRRLQIVETTAIDAKNRLVLVRRDSVEHLLATQRRRCRGGGGGNCGIEAARRGYESTCETDCETTCETACETACETSPQQAKTQVMDRTVDEDDKRSKKGV